MKEFAVHNTKGQKIDTLKLNEKVFGQKVNENILHQVIILYQSNKRLGAASTKNRSQVRGGGKKPWQQKGTGRARAGSIRSPIFKGGGVIFGPKPKDYSYSLPKKMKKKALLSSISLKLQNNNFVVIDKIELDKPKTKSFVEILKALKLQNDNNKLLFIVESFDQNLKKSSCNLKNVSVKNVNNFNAYDVLLHNKLIITKKSVEFINKNFSL